MDTGTRVLDSTLTYTRVWQRNSAGPLGSRVELHGR